MTVLTMVRSICCTNAYNEGDINAGDWRMLAALTTECHELTQINNGFDTDFEHTASRDINR